MSHSGSCLIYGTYYLYYLSNEGLAHMCSFLKPSDAASLFFFPSPQQGRSERHTSWTAFKYKHFKLSAVVKIRHRNRSIQLSFDLLCELSRSMEFIIHYEHNFIIVFICTYVMNHPARTTVEFQPRLNKQFESVSDSEKYSTATRSNRKFFLIIVIGWPSGYFRCTNAKPLKI